MMDPDDVARYVINASGLRLQQLRQPLVGWLAGVVELTHDRDPRLVVKHERLIIDGQSVAIERNTCCGVPIWTR